MSQDPAYSRGSRVEIAIGLIASGLQFMYPDLFPLGKVIVGGGLLVAAHGVFPDLYKRSLWSVPGWPRLYALFFLLTSGLVTWKAPQSHDDLDLYDISGQRRDILVKT